MKAKILILFFVLISFYVQSYAQVHKATDGTLNSKPTVYEFKFEPPSKGVSNVLTGTFEFEGTTFYMDGTIKNVDNTNYEIRAKAYFDSSKEKIATVFNVKSKSSTKTRHFEGRCPLSFVKQASTCEGDISFTLKF